MAVTESVFDKAVGLTLDVNDWIYDAFCGIKAVTEFF